jgi:pimeloyl-ACP methyl ester carboxylesterase
MTPKSGEECTDDMLAGTRRNTKNVEFHLLPNAGHFAFIDQPTPFEDIVRSKWRRS